MVEPVSAIVSLVETFTNFVPELGRSLVQWRNECDWNPTRLESLKQDIESCRSKLAAVLSAFNNEISLGNLRCPETWPFVKGEFGSLDKRLEQLLRDCAQLEIRKLRNMVYPTQVHDRVKELQDVLDESKNFVQRLVALFSEMAPAGDVEDRFHIVRNVPCNPSDLILDFASTDETGEPCTPEAELKAAIFDKSNGGAAGVVAHGTGGSGKSCALRALGLLQETEKEFSGGTLYIAPGADGTLAGLIESIAQIVERTGGKGCAARIRNTEKITLPTATDLAGEWFQRAPCLFLVDDIWYVNGITANCIQQLANLAKHPESRIAYTTRDTAVAFGRKVAFNNRPSQGGQARDILSKCAELSPLSGTANAFEKILDMCNGLPLALSLSGRVVRRLKARCGPHPENAWEHYLDLVKGRGVLAVDNPDEKAYMKGTVLTTLGLINEDLHIDAARKYFTSLCVLRRQQYIPAHVIQRLWKVSYETVVDIIARLEKYSVALVRLENDVISVSLHDLLLEIAQEMSSEDMCENWSAVLLESYSPICSEDAVNTERIGRPLREICDWWKEVKDDEYIFRNVCWLLKHVQLTKHLVEFIRDPVWIVEWLRSRGNWQLGDDVQLALDSVRASGTTSSQMSIDDRDHAESFLRTLREAAHMSARRVREAKWDGMIWFQIYGRMVHLIGKNPIATEFPAKLDAAAPRPWLRPSAGFLSPAGESLRHEIEFEGKCLCVARTDAKILMCLQGSDAIYVKEYDPSARIEREPKIVVSGVRSWDVTCAAFSRSGEHLAVGIPGGCIVLCELYGDSFCEDNETLATRDEAERVESLPSDNVTPPCSAESDEQNGCVCFPRCLPKLRFGEQRSRARRMRSESGRLDGGDGSCAAAAGSDSSKCSRLTETPETRCRLSEGSELRFWDEIRHYDFRLPHSKLAHSSADSISSVAVDDIGRTVVSGSRDRKARVWERDGEQWVSSELTVHTDWVNDVAVSANGRTVVSGSDDRTARVWEWDGEQWVSSELTGHTDWVIAVAVNADGRTVVSGSVDSTARVWGRDGEQWVSSELTGHTFGVNVVAVSGDGRTVVSSSWESPARVWERDGEQWLSSELSVPMDWKNVVAVSADGRTVVSGSDDSTARVWERDGEQWVSSELTVHTDWVNDVAVSANGRTVVSGSVDSTARVWEWDGEQWVSSELTGHTDWVIAVAVSADGRTVVSGSVDSTARVWERDGEQWVSSELTGHTDCVRNVAVSADGRTVVSGSLDNTARVWERDGEQWVSSELTGHTDWVIAVAVSADGRTVVSGSRNRTVRVWERDGEQWVSSELTGHTDWVIAVAVSADGRTVVAGSSDSTARVWEKVGDEWTAGRESEVGANEYALNVDVHAGSSWSLDDKVITEVKFASPGSYRAWWKTRFGYFVTLDRKPYLVQIDFVSQ